MAKDDQSMGSHERLADSPALADALEGDRFKTFLDHIPFAVAVSELHPCERITYANPEFERLTGRLLEEVEGKGWEALPPSAGDGEGSEHLAAAILARDDYIGVFKINRGESLLTVDAWSNVISDEEGNPMFRLVSLAENADHQDITLGDERRKKILADETLLRELQHRVKNNLQMITALIRVEARNIPDKATIERFDRLAGRVEALGLLYRSLSDQPAEQSIDLGIYLSQVATAVMAAHSVEGIHLNLQIDTWPVSVDVAMPAGLVVNEVLTNSLKHAFEGSAGGTITLHSLVDDEGCHVVISDDGTGLRDGAQWPVRGKMAALIVQSLRANAKTRVDVESVPGKGVRVTMFFARPKAPEAAKAPEAPGA